MIESEPKPTGGLSGFLGKMLERRNAAARERIRIKVEVIQNEHALLRQLSLHSDMCGEEIDYVLGYVQEDPHPEHISIEFNEGFSVLKSEIMQGPKRPLMLPLRQKYDLIIPLGEDM